MGEDHCLFLLLVMDLGGEGEEGEEGTLMLPMRLAMEDATSIEIEQMMLVVKKMEARLPSGRENLLRKKYVIQDLHVVSIVQREGFDNVHRCKSGSKRVQGKQDE